MSIDFPQIDFIIHSALDEMRKNQAEYVKLMNQSNNFINITFESLIDRITRQYESVSIIDVLTLVKNTLDEEKMACDYSLIYDDILSNASIVSQALKKVITHPSSKLEKIEKNVVSNKVKIFDSKTMAWLAKRPGNTIQEIIGAKNLVPTKVTHFTLDTMENRHTLYLYDCLYDNLYEKIYPNDGELPCEACDHPKESCYGRFEKMRDILLLKKYIRSDEWKEVKKEKQLKQNNKLMSDKEYKQIWDAVRNIDFYEQNCKSVWDNLLQRYQFIAFIIVCAQINNLAGFKTYDMFTQFIDNGMLELLNDNGTKNTVSFYCEDKTSTITVVLETGELHVAIYEYNTINNVNFTKRKIYDKRISMSGFFEELEVIESKQLEADKLENEIMISLAEIKKIDDKLYKENYEISDLKNKQNDFKNKKQIIALLMKSLIDVGEEMNHNVKEK